MTGNVSLISDHVSAGDLYLAIAFFSIVAMFVAGAFAASLFIQIGKRYKLPAIYPLTLLAEAALLMGIGVYALKSGSAISGVGTIGVISFSMGIQNAASTRIRKQGAHYPRIWRRDRYWSWHCATARSLRRACWQAQSRSPSPAQRHGGVISGRRHGRRALLSSCRWHSVLRVLNCLAAALRQIPAFRLA